MVLQLKQIFSVVGDRLNIDYEIGREYLDQYQYYSFKTPIAVRGYAENRAGVVSLSFSCEFSMEHICDRCLCEFTREYRYEFGHTLVRSAANDEYIVCPDNTLDMDELAVSDLLLELPAKILCRVDCKGLCPRCGADLNSGKCRCGN